MPKLERQSWRAGDAEQILVGATILGRVQGTAKDGGRFDGLRIAPKLHHEEGCPIERDAGEWGARGLDCTCPTIEYVVYWHKSNFLVEELPAEGSEFVCDTCGTTGRVGVDGPFYTRGDVLDRDPRDGAGSRCRSCTTKVEKAPIL